MKYGFFDQYDQLSPGTTNAWAFDQIITGSRVLEIGCSIGYLTKHLKEDKKCRTDIVEFDQEAGKIAAQFAERAYIGEDGNLDNDCLKHIQCDEKYDYVVILDVLEHLRTPENVLRDVRNLLKPEGKLILSVPNIAHNAVLINLFNNQFQYTDLGLLDRTHITFFTYSTLIEMLWETGYVAEEFKTRSKGISETEIPVSYDQLTRNIRTDFKCRPYADAYQFLLIAHLKKNEQDIGMVLPDYEGNAAFQCSLYYSENEKQSFEEDRKIQRNVTLGKNRIEYEIKPPQRRFCIGPTGYNCILQNLRIQVVDEEGQTEVIDHYNTEGTQFADGYIVFTGNMPASLKFQTDLMVKRVTIEFDLLVCDHEILELIDQPMKMLPQMHKELLQVYSDKGTLAQENKQMHEELLQVYSDKGMLTEELVAIKRRPIRWFIRHTLQRIKCKWLQRGNRNE